MNLPNKLTLIRIVLIPVFVLFVYLQFTGHYFVALGVFAVASLTDFFDGYIARKYDLVTDLGKFMDPIADKVLVLSAFAVMLCYPFYDNAFACAFGWETGLILGGVGLAIISAREMVVSSLRMIAAKKGVVLAAEKIGKIKTFFSDLTIVEMLVAGAIVPINGDAGKVLCVIGLALYGVSVLLTIVSGASYLVKNRGVFSEK